VNAAELEEMMHGLREAAAEAGALAHRGFRRRVTVEHKGAVDLVTEFDRDCEALLRDRVRSLLGDLADVVGEEAGGASSADHPTLWIDPIDGTTNFVHGYLFWCVSLGLSVRGECVLGVVRAPALGLEWYGYYAGSAGSKAMRRSWGALHPDGIEECAECKPSTVVTLDDALLATGFPYDRKTSADNNFDAFVAIKKRCQAVRRCGSAAIDLCLVADGTYDGYWEKKLRPWDIAAGLAIVRAAGGEATDFGGTNECLARGEVIATNGRIHASLRAELANVSM